MQLTFVSPDIQHFTKSANKPYKYLLLLLYVPAETAESAESWEG